VSRFFQNPTLGSLSPSHIRKRPERLVGVCFFSCKTKKVPLSKFLLNIQGEGTFFNGCDFFCCPVCKGKKTTFQFPCEKLFFHHGNLLKNPLMRQQNPWLNFSPPLGQFWFLIPICNPSCLSDFPQSLRFQLHGLEWLEICCLLVVFFTCDSHLRPTSLFS